ncbi:MAG TPA: hypothetical protein VIV12_22485 [Streptosporangiaceae bacterium]
MTITTPAAAARSTPPSYSARKSDLLAISSKLRCLRAGVPTPVHERVRRHPRGPSAG